LGKHRLVPHLDTSSSALSEILVEVARTELGDFALHYRAEGDINRLRIPAPVPYSSRQEMLWEKTCFEAFVRIEGRAGYAEFNFAPSTGWAAYEFSDYRAGRSLIDLPAPHFGVETANGALDVWVTIDATDLPCLQADAPWKLNLAAVIEETDGTKSYWALAHPPGDKPDFHDPACFALELPPADNPLSSPRT
jgi:hypothetical protein